MKWKIKIKSFSILDFNIKILENSEMFLKFDQMNNKGILVKPRTFKINI